jgi:hypothetical protein
MPAAALYRLVVKKTVNVTGGPSSGTEYVMDGACAACGTGAVQRGALRLPRFKAPSADLFSTLDDEILVSGTLAELLFDRGLKCLGPVVHGPTSEPLPFLQLVPEAVLPPFSRSQTGFVRERPCPTCGRDGYFGIPHVSATLTYDQLPPSLLEKDLLATFERFGNSRLRTPFRDSVFAAPLYVAGARLAEVLRSANVRTVQLEPVNVGAISGEMRAAGGEGR